MEELITALAETKTTLGFDAIGGGPLAGQLLVAGSHSEREIRNTLAHEAASCRMRRFKARA
jgi:hypothetical protein